MSVALFFFAMSHIKIAKQDITTNEQLWDTYKQSPNPFNTDDNFHKFWSVYPYSRSNIYEFKPAEIIDQHDSMMRTILDFYGTPLYTDIE